MTVMLAAIKSAFDGTSIGEFLVWLNRIIARRGIADFHRDREDDPSVGPLPTEHQGEEEIWGEEPSEADETGAVVVQSVIDECLEELSDAHRDGGRAQRLRGPRRGRDRRARQRAFTATSTRR